MKQNPDSNYLMLLYLQYCDKKFGFEIGQNELKKSYVYLKSKDQEKKCKEESYSWKVPCLIKNAILKGLAPRINLGIAVYEWKAQFKGFNRPL